MTARRKEMPDFYLQTLQENNIDTARVVYAGAQKGQSKQYVGESPDLVRRFLDFYKEQFRAAHIVFTDDGTAFVDKGTDVIDSFGIRRVVYPPAIHQFVSPNDNRLHGESKQVWRTTTVDTSDDVVTSIRLLKHIDDVSAEHVEQWFSANFLVGVTGRLDKKAANVISGPPHKKLAFYRECLSEYRRHANGEPPLVGASRGPTDSALDGVYWQDWDD